MNPAKPARWLAQPTDLEPPTAEGATELARIPGTSEEKSYFREPATAAGWKSVGVCVRETMREAALSRSGVPALTSESS